ncbi:hypothetical protein E0I61_15570 [Flavobacterium ranwuense]|uniref:Uncharacterized protein n=1 Tax=Flavobacterium ranwuense TaxID=2541725 RepID=A0ABY2DMQ0_9FLAO|nr:hypothetical protein [Flavobacterium ranwuense]TDE27064.1 hypothetical protein E0I61_15570 [Flavobacterium ranwuense]
MKTQQKSMKEEIINWINNIHQIDGIPPKEVIAFNFGIYEDETGYKMYLVGGFEYDENNDDWASIELPKELHRYLNLPVKLQSETWDFILDYCANTLIELETEGKLNNPLLQNAIAITTGFDDGDLIKIR